MFRSMMDGISRDLGSKDMVIVLSGARNFRYTLTPDYKSNRKGLRKPIVYRPLTEWLHGEYPGRVVSKECLEADDYMGILATTPNAPDRIIVSEDKDMLTVPAKVFRQGTLQEQTLDMAELAWFTQTLTGDSADGYKGCPGVGAVKAKALLARPGDRWASIVSAYVKAGLREKDAVLQARLARIARHDDWDAANQRVRLWAPDGYEEDAGND